MVVLPSVGMTIADHERRVVVGCAVAVAAAVAVGGRDVPHLRAGRRGHGGRLRRRGAPQAAPQQDQILLLQTGRL